MQREELICRCEEVSKEQILEAIRAGACSLEDVKKRTRAGMGYCQGKTCRKLIAKMLAAYYELPVDRFLPGSIRMPVGPITIGMLASMEEDGV